MFKELSNSSKIRDTDGMLFTFSRSVLKHVFIVGENIPNNIWRPKTETNNYKSHAEGDTNSDDLETAITIPTCYNERKISFDFVNFQLRFIGTTF